MTVASSLVLKAPFNKAVQVLKHQQILKISQEIKVQTEKSVGAKTALCPSVRLVSVLIDLAGNRSKAFGSSNSAVLQTHSRVTVPKYDSSDCLNSSKELASNIPIRTTAHILQYELFEHECMATSALKSEARHYTAASRQTDRQLCAASISHTARVLRNHLR